MTPEPEVAAALDAARHLVAHGVPVFVAKWDDSRGDYVPPLRWQLTEPNPEVIDAWRPGDALCAVSGCGADVIDIDPRNGGSLAALDGMMPTTYGTARTPSGGTHEFIATLGVPKGTPFAGVDVQSGDPEGQGRGFVFLAPTVRRSRLTGELVAYRWESWPNLDPLTVVGGDLSGAALADLMRSKRSAWTVESVDYDGQAYGDLTEGQKAQADQYLADQADLWRGKFAEAERWPEGETDERGRGWEALSRDWAWVVAKMVAAPWVPLGEADGERLHDEILPAVIAVDPKCSGKFTDRELEKAYGHPVAVPPWDRIAREFEVLPDEPAPPDERRARAVARLAERLRIRREAEEHLAAEDAARSGVRRLQRVDLTEVLDPDYEEPRPEILTREDGVALFERGSTHAIVGGSGAGKTWLALLAVAQEIRAGRSVDYIDFEDSEAGMAVRLLQMGHDRDQIRRLFRYRRPLGAWSEADVTALCAEVATSGLVIVDGVTEALSLVGKSSDSDTDVAWLYGGLGTRLANEGPAVIFIDHLTNEGAESGKAIRPRGSGHKLGGLSGTALVVDGQSPMGRGMLGDSHVSLTPKGRGGWLAQHSEPGVAENKRRIARLEVDDTGESTVVTLGTPVPASNRSTAQVRAANESRLMDDIVSLWEFQEPGEYELLSKRAIKAKLKARDIRFTWGKVDDLVDEMGERGFLVEQKKYGWCPA